MIYSSEHLKRHYFQNSANPHRQLFNSENAELMEDLAHNFEYVFFIIKTKLSYLINGDFYTIYRYSTITHRIKPVSDYYEFEDYNDAKRALYKRATT